MPARRHEPAMDPGVAQVEEWLEAASTVEPARLDGHVVTTHAVWFCACETFDDSPTWLIYAVGDDGIGWERIPEGLDIPDVVEAEHLTGCHPAPDGVLAWLRGEHSGPWPGTWEGDFPEDSYIYDEIARRIRPATSG